MFNGTEHKDKIQQFEGKCFKLHFILTSRASQYAFEIYYSKRNEHVLNYMNRFMIIAKIEGKDKSSHSSLSHLQLKIKDEFHKATGEPILVEFTGQQFPLVWRSIGQFLKISLGVITPEDLPANLHVTIIAMVIYNTDDITTFLSTPSDVKVLCTEKADFQTLTSCLSIYDNFAGSWNDANDVCMKQGGYLWSLNNGHEWDEVFFSPRFSKEKDILPPNNATQFLQKSSIIFLGLKSNSKVSFFSSELSYQ